MVLNEVQEAMKLKDESNNATLNSLKNGNWVTPDLNNLFATNEIIARGLSKPKCLAALQLMQTNPREAEKQFKGDPEVDEFMNELSKTMASHFGNLAEKQQKKEKTIPSAPPVQDIGPLHAQVIANKKTGSVNMQSYDPKEEERVKDIVNDPELSAMLLDPDLQQILIECGDPRKFQCHMQNPETARKIKKLYQSGLVGTAT